MSESSSSDDAVAVTTFLLAYRKFRRKRKDRCIRPSPNKKEKKTVKSTILPEPRLKDTDSMRQCIHLNREQYHDLLQLMTPHIKKEDTHMKDAVTADERLTLTLRYLTTDQCTCMKYYSTILCGSVALFKWKPGHMS
ncbi:hypothetical protein E2C01_007616 [Portunus trituberculatus]|uniref:Uncharacterized protein n=1 Tax=Portunus trituberculatus TaxID=210409 RepID=A0A5B7CZG8_PORTR|nr:hypothetical protein [Portunus trituberculatus]